jgi:hypothetical protein
MASKPSRRMRERAAQDSRTFLSAVGTGVGKMADALNHSHHQFREG